MAIKESISNIKNTSSNVNTGDLTKLKLLFTIVNREKAEFYMDLISTFNANLQLVCMGKGTATVDIKNSLGIKNSDKAVLISIVRSDKVSDIMDTLDQKFKTIRDGSGIAYTVPLTSVIGVSIYRFLSNNRM